MASRTARAPRRPRPARPPPGAGSSRCRRRRRRGPRANSSSRSATCRTPSSAASSAPRGWSPSAPTCARRGRWRPARRRRRCGQQPRVPGGVHVGERGQPDPQPPHDATPSELDRLTGWPRTARRPARCRARPGCRGRSPAAAGRRRRRRRTPPARPRRASRPGAPGQQLAAGAGVRPLEDQALGRVARVPEQAAWRRRSEKEVRKLSWACPQPPSDMGQGAVGVGEDGHPDGRPRLRRPRPRRTPAPPRPRPTGRSRSRGSSGRRGCRRTARCRRTTDRSGRAPRRVSRSTAGAPTRPAATRSRAAAYSGKKRTTWPGCSCTPAASHAAIIATASSRRWLSGFSQMTCPPGRRRAEHDVVVGVGRRAHVDEVAAGEQCVQVVGDLRPERGRHLLARPPGSARAGARPGGARPRGAGGRSRRPPRRPRSSGVPAGGGHLTAPWSMPLMNLRWKRRYTTRIGRMTMRVPAASTGTSLEYWPTKNPRPAGAVRWLGVLDEDQDEQELVPRPHEEQHRHRRQRRAPTPAAGPGAGWSATTPRRSGRPR